MGIYVSNIATAYDTRPHFWSSKMLGGGHEAKKTSWEKGLCLRVDEKK